MKKIAKTPCSKQKRQIYTKFGPPYLFIFSWIFTFLTPLEGGGIVEYPEWKVIFFSIIILWHSTVFNKKVIIAKILDLEARNPNMPSVSLVLIISKNAFSQGNCSLSSKRDNMWIFNGLVCATSMRALALLRRNKIWRKHGIGVQEQKIIFRRA